MIPKRVDWSVLAQCNFFAVEKFVQTTDRPAMRTVAPLSEANLLRKLKRDKKWKETFEIVFSAYKSLHPGSR